MRLCIPKVNSRGAEPENEMIPWAKAFIASQEFDANPFQPAWSLNQRANCRYFGASRFDWRMHRVLSLALPCYTFSKADFVATGE